MAHGKRYGLLLNEKSNITVNGNERNYHLIFVEQYDPMSCKYSSFTRKKKELPP